jgi:glycosyltransferase involved in cell wall biosynthesis
MIISQLLDLPFTVTAHACDIYAHESDLLALITGMADRVVTISDCNKEAILQKSRGVDRKRIEVIHCGIDMEQFQRTNGRPVNHVFQITSVGSLVEKKGHEYLIRACSESKARGLSFECVIIGEGQLKQDLQALIQELDVADRVTLVGGQSQAWVHDRLARSDLFALACMISDETGDRDGIPVAMMEALAMEVPVLSTAVSGIPELIRHEETGLLVPQKDPVALAAAMVRLARDESLRQRLAENGRALVEREHDIKKNASQMVGLFQEVIEERGG